MIHLYTDASYDVDNNISGWGCALVSDELESFASGYSKNIPDIIHAEAHAVKMGIINFMMDFAYPQDLIIWCDNKGVCGMLMRQGRDYPSFNKIRSEILDLLHSNGIPYHFNYLPRRFNDHAIKADTLAKKQLKKVMTITDKKVQRLVDKGFTKKEAFRLLEGQQKLEWKRQIKELHNG